MSAASSARRCSSRATSARDGERKADRPGLALAFGYAVMGPASGQVEHVAGPSTNSCSVKWAGSSAARRPRPAKNRFAGGPMRLPPCACSRKTSAVEVRTDTAAVAGGMADHQGRPAAHPASKELLQQASGRQSCRSNRRPATSSVHRRYFSGRQCARQTGRGASARPQPWRTRRACVLRRQREQRRGPQWAKAGMAWRTSNGFFCQWRCMNCEGERPPSRRRGLSDVHGTILQ